VPIVAGLRPFIQCPNGNTLDLPNGGFAGCVFLFSELVCLNYVQDFGERRSVGVGRKGLNVGKISHVVMVAWQEAGESEHGPR
jgi:hypothetical protein